MAKRTFTKYPDKYIKASTDFTSIDVSKPLEYFSDEEISMLPEKFCARTRIPGGNNGYKFAIIQKSKYLKDPTRCFFIDGYWHYAYPTDIYLVTQEQLNDYKEQKLKELEREKQRLIDEIYTYSRYLV